MSSSRTKGRLAIAVLTCLAAMTSGCVWPRTPTIFSIREPVRVESVVSPSTVVMRPTDQRPLGGWPPSRHSLPGPIADVRPRQVPPVEALPQNADQPQPPGPADVVPVPSGLTISLVDLADPALKGTKLTYQIIVSNDGPAPERNVSVVVTIPYGMVPVPLETVGPGGRTIDGQIVRFDPLAELPPGEQREYQIVVRTRQHGQLTVRAELTSDRLTRPLGAEATTDVLP